MEYTVTYDSNNSGGGWWLDDDDWRLLEAKDWKVAWRKDDPDGLFTSEDGRFLGALATSASKVFDCPTKELAVEIAMTEWEFLLNKDADDEGCHCCGQPHSFYCWDQAA